jgi:hypothetical protein
MANEWIIGGSFNGAFGRRAESARLEYFNGNSLKSGYESRFLGNGDYVDDQGAVAVYTNDYDDLWDSYEPMRDKANYGIFQTGPTAAQQAAAAPPPVRSTGEYDDIIGSLKVDQAAAIAQANKYAAQQAQQYQTQTAALTASFNDQITNLNTANAANVAGLNAQYDQQAAEFADFQTVAAGQLAAAEANYQEQQRMVGNLQSAFVPEANPNAFNASVGDQRADDSRPKRSNKLSDLSSLSIVSGLGTAANPLSGLQLA